MTATENRYGLPEGMPQDRYGHASLAETDPIGLMTYGVGCNDQYIVFDYSHFDWNNRKWVALHSCYEIPGDCGDYEYHVVEATLNGALRQQLLMCAHGMVVDALDWLDDRNRKHHCDSFGSESFYFLRSLAVSSARLYLSAEHRFSRQAREFLDREDDCIRMGGPLINQFVNEMIGVDLLRTFQKRPAGDVIF